MTLHLDPKTLDLSALAAELAPLGASERVRLARTRIPGRLVFTTSFGLEDQALTHAIVESGTDVEFVTLDTGRLFNETLELWAATEAFFGIRIRGVTPDKAAVEALVARYGPLGLRRSIAARQACCAVRKVTPLGEALAGASAWVTGLRADQSAHRSRTPFAEFDAGQGLAKLNPLADWDRDRVARHIATHAVPYNPLHDRGFPSIGCAPCTRAVQAGEPERAGRWWWEAEAKRECGLHDRPPAAASRPEATIS